MLVRSDGLICGSVSGGCVESAVVEASLKAIDESKTCELTFEAVTEDSIWDVGLSCGGRIQIWIDPSPFSAGVWEQLRELVLKNKPFAAVSSLEIAGMRLWTPDQDDFANGALTDVLNSRRSAEIKIGEERTFVNLVRSPETVIVVGSVHIAVPLVKFAHELGFHTVVIDPRATFANPERFAAPPDRLIADWPGPALHAIGITDETYAVVLTHDPKIDDAALAILLRSPARYIGALGSRTTQAKRRDSLRTMGISDEQLARIHGPIGIRIGARSPEEIALSIMAEIVQVRRETEPIP